MNPDDIKKNNDLDFTLLHLTKLSNDLSKINQSDIDSITQEINSLQSYLTTTTPETPSDKTPVFMKNYAQDKGLSIKELLENSTPKNKKTATSSQKVVQEENPKQHKKLLDRSKIKTLGDALRQKVFGQDQVIDEIVDILKVAALNIKINKNKPAGCYLLAGPSGVGKTELAQTLAEQLNVPILKINMGEYSQEQDISKLIGTAKGLVGYDEGGLLTNFVKENPSAVILFDELEKADPSIDKILLSIMDHGTCTANDGTEVSFKETIIISTSNLGAEVEYYPDLSKSEKDTLRMDYIKGHLKPEIINRYDSIFHLNSLSPDIYKKVTLKFLSHLIKSINEEHKFSLQFSDKLIDFIVDKSYDPAMGGRPARKFIEKLIIKPLADYMLEEEFEKSILNNPLISMDINKKGNLYFKGKNNKILGTLENTNELVSIIENGKFTNKETRSPPN